VASGMRFDNPQPRAAETTLRSLEPPLPRGAALARVAETISSPVIESPAPVLLGPVSEPNPPPSRTPAQPWPAPSPASPQPAAPPAASSSDRGQAGWLSSLLAAASRDEPEAAAPKAAETLDALALEISGLIDNAAAVEMWDRWRRGDNAAVSRRLYTEAGQQAFDEIRRRYRADPLFRDTTTRYMQEFERLLAKVSQNDRDGSQWRAYLLSNTGKVYTILAHASGRLG